GPAGAGVGGAPRRGRWRGGRLPSVRAECGRFGLGWWGGGRGGGVAGRVECCDSRVRRVLCSGFARLRHSCGGASFCFGLTFSGIDRALVVDEAEEGGDIAQEERRQILATIAFVGRVSTTEHQRTCAGAIAWNAQIHGIAHVSAELELMVAADLGPIIDELEL